MINTATGQRRVIRKKGDLTTGKGDWLRIGLTDKKYAENYNKIDWNYTKRKKNIDGGS